MVDFFNTIDKKNSIMAQQYGGALKPPAATNLVPPAPQAAAPVVGAGLTRPPAVTLTPRANMGPPGVVMAPRYNGPMAAPLDPGKVAPEKATTLFGKGGIFGDVAQGGTGTYGSFTAHNNGPGMPATISGSGGNDALYQMSLLRGGGMSAEDAAKSIEVAGGYGLNTANAGLAGSRTRTEDQTGVPLGLGQAHQADAAGGLSDVTARLMPARSAAQNALDAAQAGYAGAQSGAINNEQRRLNMITQTLPKDANGNPIMPADPNHPIYHTSQGGPGSTLGLIAPPRAADGTGGSVSLSQLQAEEWARRNRR